MRAALYLVGHIRTYETTYSSILRYVISPIERDLGMPVDIFAYTARLNIKKGVSGGHPANEEAHDRDFARIREIYADRLRVLCIHEDDPTNLLEESEVVNNNLAHIRQTTSDRACRVYTAQLQWYKVHRCDVARRDHETAAGVSYGVIVKARFDLLFHSELEIARLAHANSGIPLVYLPHDPRYYEKVGYYYDGTQGTNDLYAFGSAEPMSVYCDLINHYGRYHYRSLSGPVHHPWTLQLFASGIPPDDVLCRKEWLMYCSEKQLGLHLFENGIRIAGVATNATVARFA